MNSTAVTDDERPNPPGGIHGIGTDIVLLDRIVVLYRRHGERFARRVLGPDELREFQRRHATGAIEHGVQRSLRYLAKRFAGKEAFSKALGTGLRGPMTLLSLQILNDRRGRPVAVARNALAPHLEQLGVRAHISLSDEKDSALAFVILENKAL